METIIIHCTHALYRDVALMNWSKHHKLTIVLHGLRCCCALPLHSPHVFVYVLIVDEPIFTHASNSVFASHFHSSNATDAVVASASMSTEPARCLMMDVCPVNLVSKLSTTLSSFTLNYSGAIMIKANTNIAAASRGKIVKRVRTWNLRPPACRCNSTHGTHCLNKMDSAHASFVCSCVSVFVLINGILRPEPKCVCTQIYTRPTDINQTFTGSGGIVLKLVRYEWHGKPIYFIPTQTHTHSFCSGKTSCECVWRFVVRLPGILASAMIGYPPSCTHTGSPIKIH